MAKIKITVPCLLLLIFSLTPTSLLADSTLLHSAAEPDYPPLSLINSNGKADGFSVELLKEAAAAAGYQIQFRTDFWATIKQELLDQKLDILPLMAASPEREKDFDFSIPYLVLHGAIVTRRNTPEINSLEMLKQHRLGSMRSDFAHEFIEQEKAYKTLQLYDTFEQALEALNQGELDAIVMQELLAHQLIRDGNFTNLVITNHIDTFRQKFSFGVKENNKVLLARINEGLSIVIANGTLDQLKEKWLGKLLIENNHETNLFHIAIAISISLALAYLAALSWQKSLRIRITERTRELRQVQQNLEKTVEIRTRELVNQSEKLDQAQIIAGIGSYVWDIKKDQTIWSDNLYRLLGHAPHEFEPTYDRYLSFIHADDKKTFMSLTGQALKAKSSYSAEYRIIRKDGKILDIFEQGKVELDENENPLMLVGVIHDVTEQKQTEATLKERFEFINTVFDLAANIIIVVDAEGRFLRFNRAAQELTGYDRSEVLGQYVYDILTPEEDRDQMTALFTAMRNGEMDLQKVYEAEWVSKNGERHLIQWHNSVVLEDGKISHFISLGYDITQSRLDEKERQRLQRELNQARKMEALGQLTGGIAHDFNNMLGAIIGYTDLTISKLSPEETQLHSYLEQVELASERAKKLITQMMVFSRTDASESRPVNLAAEIDKSTDMLRSMLPSSIDIETEIAEKLPRVIIDPTQFHQIMLNLCINARDAMNGVGKILIRLKEADIQSECILCHKRVEGRLIEFAIIDNGCGMSQQVLDHIFEPFFTTKDIGKGTGMGMSVVSSIIETHGGHLLINTSPGAGTEIRILFPPHESDMGNEEENNTRNTGFFDGRGRHILIVDDEESMAHFLSESLSLHGFKTTVMTESPKALEAFLSEPDKFSAVLTDQTMPELNGIDMIKKMREVKPDLPVILATGFSESVNRSSAEALGIKYLQKPLKISQIMTTLETCLTPVDNEKTPAT